MSSLSTGTVLLVSVKHLEVLEVLQVWQPVRMVWQCVEASWDLHISRNATDKVTIAHCMC